MTRRALGPRLQSFFLAPLGWLYAAVAALRVAAFRRGWLRSTRAPMPTLSIGNLAVGGTGKTPLLLHGVEWLCRYGAEVAVLSRGYGGDEGRILERRHPKVKLYEGSDRRASLRRLQQEGGAEVILLDDGFQHLRLQRDLDVVVLDATRPFGPCLPAGLFREGARALRRADLVVMSRAELVDAACRERIWRRVDQVRSGLDILPRLEGGMRIDQIRRLHDDVCRQLAELHGAPACLAAGIGNPESFQALCVAAGVQVVATDWRRDHHAWCAADVRRWDRHAQVLVTEKDGVKLRPFAPANVWEVVAEWEFWRGGEEWEERLNRFYLPVRAAHIEPLWSAHDPDGRAAR